MDSSSFSPEEIANVMGWPAAMAMEVLYRHLIEEGQTDTATALVAYPSHPTPEIIPLLTGFLAGQDTSLVRAAIRLLARLHPESWGESGGPYSYRDHPQLEEAISQLAVPSLVNELSSEDKIRRLEGLVALGRIFHLYNKGDDHNRDRAWKIFGPLSDRDLARLTEVMVEEIYREFEISNWCEFPEVVQTESLRRMVVEALRKDLDNESEETRIKAATALGLFYPQGKVATDDLIAALDDMSEEVQQWVVHSLGELRDERALSALIELLQRSEEDYLDSAVLEQIFLALGKLGEKAVSAQSALEKSLEADEEWVQIGAAEVLEKIGPSAQSALPKLRTVWREGDYALVDAAFQALRAIGGTEEIPLFQKALSHQYTWVQLSAARALGDLGEEAAVAVEDLLALLPAEDWEVGEEVFRALGKMGQGAAVAVPRLEELVESNRPEVQLGAAEALARLDRENRRALEVLVESLESDDRAIWKGAGLALVRILTTYPHHTQRGDIEGLLEKKLASDHPWPSMGAASVFIRTSSSPAQEIPILVPTLIERLQDEDPEVIQEGAMVLGELGSSALPALPWLMGLAGKKPADWTVVSAIKALGMMGSIAAPAIPVLESWKGDDFAGEVAEDALEKIRS